MISSSPSQKCGTQAATIETIVTPTSVFEFGFRAETMPSGIATSTETSRPMIPSCRVGATRWSSSLATGILARVDVPRSPRRTRPAQSRYWTTSGRFSPSSERICW